MSEGSPELTSAGAKAVAPGSVCTSIPAATASLTRKNPGSEIPGVPASETNAISCPLFNFSNKLLVDILSSAYSINLDIEALEDNLIKL